MAKPFAIIQIGEPPKAVLSAVGQPSDWLVNALSLAPREYRIYRPDRQEALPPSSTISGAIITGAWVTLPGAPPWFEDIAVWIRRAHCMHLPLLGICHGHALITYALGGIVNEQVLPDQGGLHLIELQDAHQHEPLLKHLPQRIAGWFIPSYNLVKAPYEAQIMGISAPNKMPLIKYSDTTLSLQCYPALSVAIVLACFHDDSRVLYSLADSAMQPDWTDIILRRFYQYWCTAPDTQPMH